MRLVEWLATVPQRAAAPDTDPVAEEIVLATRILDDAASGLGERVAAVQDPVFPINVSQRLLATIHRCEQLAVAETVADLEETPVEETWEMFRGKALDSYVCHVIHEGAVADPIEDLRSQWIANDRPAEIESLERHLGIRGDPADAAQVRERTDDLAALAASAGAFAELRDRFARVEVTVAWTAAETVRLPGRLDVLLGGPGTPYPAALIEVKSGVHRADHSAQLRHYLMLTALTHGQMPVAAALWYPGSGWSDTGSTSTGSTGTGSTGTGSTGTGSTGTSEMCVDVPVVGTVASSARRTAGALERLADLWDGRVPRRTGGSHCYWCPESHTCEQARATAAEWEPSVG